MQTGHALLLLSLGLGACALNARPGDGLVADELGQSHQFGTASEPSGGLPGHTPAELKSCKNPALFVQHVLPHFIERCIECHDGTKLKASFALYLADATSLDPAEQKSTCDLTLTSGVKLEDRVQSTIFTEVDPARPDLEHEFKYDDAASFALYRDAVMMWLMAE